MVRELFATPVGWMTVIGIGFMIGMGFYIRAFLRRKMREEDDRS
jgi:hypothetical protein